jgi:hypothetical protein
VLNQPNKTAGAILVICISILSPNSMITADMTCIPPATVAIYFKMSETHGNDVMMCIMGAESKHLQTLPCFWSCFVAWNSEGTVLSYCLTDSPNLNVLNGRLMGEVTCYLFSTSDTLTVDR